MVKLNLLYKQSECNIAKINNCVIVVDGKYSYLYKLAPLTLKCFYNIFNGPVCDIDHWQYFKECMIKVFSMVEEELGAFAFINEEELTDKTPSFIKKLRSRDFTCFK